MRRVISWLIDGLPFEPRSRQALDQTLLDWVHEESSAATIARRSVIHLRGVLAIARAMTSASVAETRAVPVGWLIGRLALYALLPTVGLGSVALLFSSTFDQLDAASRLALLVLAAPTLIFVNLPVGVMLGILRKSGHRDMPTAGTGVVVFILALLIGGLTAPLSVEMGREFFDLQTPSADGRTTATFTSAPGASLSSALGRAIGGWPYSFNSARSIDRLMTFSALSAVSAMLAGAMCGLYPERDRRQMRWFVVVLLAQEAIMFVGRLTNTLIGSPAGDVLCVVGLLVACAMVERSAREQRAVWAIVNAK